jgi:GTP-binding protein
MVMINTELSLYDPLVGRKPQIVAVNKIDLPEVKARMAELRRFFKQSGIEPLFVSALTGEGMDQLLTELDRVLQAESAREAEESDEVKIFRPEPEKEKVSLTQDEEGWRVESDEFERLVAGSETADPEVRRQLFAELWRWGVGKALRSAKLKPGEKFFIGNQEFYW